MTVKSLSEALHEAYIQARDMDASLTERLQAFADAVRRLGPHFQEAVDKLVARLKEQGVGETAPKPGEPGSTRTSIFSHARVIPLRIPR